MPSLKPGTIGALVVSYLRSPEYVELRDTTKKGYVSRIEAIRTKHGHRSVAGLTAERIKTAFLDPYAGKPGARLAILKMLRILIRHAIGKDWLRHDPSQTIKRPKTKEIRSWTEARDRAVRVALAGRVASSGSPSRCTSIRARGGQTFTG